MKHLEFLLIKPPRSTALSTSGSGRRNTCIRSLTDEVTLELGQCPEDVEDQLPPELVVSICSVRLLNPMPRS